MRLPYTFELTTERGVALASIDCEIEVELLSNGQPRIDAVFIDKENLFGGEMIHRSIACAIANEAENSKRVLAALEDEAAEEFAERQRRRQFA